MDLAYKLAYYTSRKTHPESSQKVITFAGNYHGRTTTTSSLTSSAHVQEGMPGSPPVIRFPYPYCYRCPFGKEYPSCDLSALSSSASSSRWMPMAWSSTLCDLPGVNAALGTHPSPYRDNFSFLRNSWPRAAPMR